MKTRAITALFFVIAMIGSFLFGPVLFGVFYLLLSAACLYEFYGMLQQRAFRPRKYLGIGLGIALFLIASSFFGLIAAVSANLLFLLVPLVLLAELYRKSDAPFLNIGFTVLGVVYVIVPFYCFYALGFLGGGFEALIPLGFLIMLWSNDTGAYLTGRLLGRQKLFLRISPGKTWEGFVGGILFALLAAFCLHYFTSSDLLPLWQWAMMALLIGIVGTGGDLVESMLKRSLSVKDSGTLLPGHGGLLDRFDGLLLAAPVVYVFLTLI